jgi:hypothetical protein
MYELYDDLVEDEGPRKREWPIRDSKGRVVAVHHRMDLPDGKKPVWWTRNGTKGLGGSNSNADDPSSIGAKLPSSQAHLYAVALDVVVVPRVLGRGIAHPLPA